jgi:hypothetical protein
MATKACVRDDVRYAMDAPRCPECGETKAYETGSPEHLAALEAAEKVDRVPDGPADKVLAWVGDTRDRALQALVAERTADKPRTTLVDQLVKLTGDGEKS